MTQSIRILLSLCLVVFLAFAGPASVLAQDMSAEQASSLADQLEDPDKRAALIESLRALEQAQKAEQETESTEPGFTQFFDSILNELTTGLVAFSVQVASLATSVFDKDGFPAWFKEQVESPDARDFWLTMMLQVGGLLTAGLFARYFMIRLLAGPRHRIEMRDYPGLVTRLIWLIVRTVLDVMPIFAFALAAYGTLVALEFGSTTSEANEETAQNLRLIAIAVIESVVITRSILAVTRLLITPLAPNLRMVPLPDQTAAYAYVWVSRFVNLSVFGFMLVDVLPALGVGVRAADGLSKIIGLTLALMGVVLILQTREQIADLLSGRGKDDGEKDVKPKVRGLLRSRLADVWHVLAIVYVLVGFAVWALEVGDGFALMARGTLGTIVAIVVAEFVVKASGQALEKLFAIDPDIERRFPGLEQRANRYLPAARGVVMVLVSLVAIIMALEAWQVDMIALFGTPAGISFISRLGRILLVVLIGVIVWEIASALVARMLASDNEAGSTTVRSQRSRTLLPLAQNALTVLIVVIGSLTILSEIGINIAPLLAGAGVVGLAIGFGAQTLVKDLITGMFILVEDAIAVGDVVDVAGHTGTVEAVTIRTVRLRDLTGTVHTVPFSSIDSVKNLTKDFSFYLLDVGVAYREDTDKVVALLRQIDDELREDPEFGSDIIAPLEVLGVNAFADSAVVIRARIKTRPLAQWRVGREFNRRMKYCFDEHNIEIPFPHQTIYFGVDREGKAPPARIAMTDAAEEQARHAATEPEIAVDAKPTSHGKGGGQDYE